MTQQTLPVIVQAPAAPRGITAGGILVGGLLLGGLGWLIYKKVDSHFKTKRRKRFTKGAADSIEKQQAIDIYNALDGGGTNEEIVFSIARQIKDWDKVVEEYNAMLDNKGDILADLHSDLNSEEMQKFWDIIRLNKQKATGQSSTGVKIEGGKFALSKANVNVRKTPRLIGTPNKDSAASFANMILPGASLLLTKSNIVKTVPKGVVVGVLTGRTEVDEKAEPNAVWFAEITTLAVDSRKEIRMWIAVSQIETITVAERQQRNIGVAVFKQAEYDKASSQG